MKGNMDSAAKAFGELVRESRKARGWSQEALAAEAFPNSTRKGYISLVENGKIPNITRDTVRNIARALEIDPEAIPDVLRWPEANEVVKDTNTVAHEIYADVSKLVAIEQDRGREFGKKEGMLIALANRFADGSPNDFEAALQELARLLEQLESPDDLPAKIDEGSVLRSSTRKFDVMIIHAGGVIGSIPSNREDVTSSETDVDWVRILECTPPLSEEELGYRLGFEELAKEATDAHGTGPQHWIETAKIIEKNYEDCEGFVVLHDTDTMVYAASALSFMLVNLAKPVVLTGATATHPFQIRNDGLQNLITALAIANPRASGIPTIPEVTIAFGSELLRGNRSRKREANGYVAFDTPNYPCLAKFGTSITVNKSAILPLPEDPFYTKKNLEPNIIDFNIFPGVVQNGIADRLFDSEDFNPKGAVIRAYGAGNLPTDERFLSRLSKATKKHGVILLNTTQSIEGSVDFGLYETSSMFLELGMLSGADLTPAAAMTKMMIALADDELKFDKCELRNFLQTNQAGEQSTSVYEVPFKNSVNRISAESPYLTINSSRHCQGSWEPQDVTYAQLRLYSVTTDDADDNLRTESEETFFEVEIRAKNTSEDGEDGGSSPVLVGQFRRANGTSTRFFDVSDVARRLFRPGQYPSFTLKLVSGASAVAWTRAELALFVNR